VWASTSSTSTGSRSRWLAPLDWRSGCSPRAEQVLPAASLAARFAAKEALAKALGAPVGLHWRDAEVHRGEDGRPHLSMRGTVPPGPRRSGSGTPTSR
jgi:hypothetical protein